MNRVTCGAFAVLGLALAGCEQTSASQPAAAVKPISEADAGKLADATAAAWQSMDAARIKALYAPSVTGFDLAVPRLPADRAEWDKRQDAYADEKMDKLVEQERRIQILDTDTFVVSGTWAGTSTINPALNGSVRCTDVYEKDASGSWPIINEHCSAVPGPRA